MRRIKICAAQTDRRSHPWESPSLYKHAEAQHKRSVSCLLTLMGGSQSLDLLKQGTVVHSCLTEHLSGGPMYYSSGRVCSWISPCHGLFSLCPQWCADGLMMRQVSGRWRMHLAAADTCQKENLLMGKEQLHSRCRLIKHCSLLASDWPAHDRGDGETALCLSLITRQDAEENKLMCLTHLPVTHLHLPDNASDTKCFHYLLCMLTIHKASAYQITIN